MKFIKFLLVIVSITVIFSCTRNFDDPNPPGPEDFEISAYSITDTTSTSFRIVFTTTDLGTTIINYGRTQDLGIVVVDTSFVEEHVYTVTNLDPETTYYVQLKSRDVYQNIASINTTIMVTTKPVDDTAPVISFLDPVVDNITSTSARINWTTDDLSYCKLFYGDSIDVANESGPNFYYIGVNDTPEDEFHQTITSLLPNTKYYFKVEAKNTNGLVSKSDILSFTTLSDVYEITDINVFGVTSNSATITFSTTKQSKSWINYGKNPSTLNFQVQNNQTVLHHLYTLTDLESDTEYYFQISAQNAINGIISSDILDFTTTSPPYLSAEVIYPEEGLFYDPDDQVGNDAVVNITIHNASDVLVVAYRIQYNNSIIKIVNPFEVGNFGNPSLYIYEPGPNFMKVTQSWEVIYQNGIPVGTEGTGTGVIAQLHIKPQGVGTSYFNFIEEDIEFLDMSGNTILKRDSESTFVTVDESK